MNFPTFLPKQAEGLSEETSIALLQQFQREEIATPLTEKPIATTYVRQGTGKPPILLLHGFDSSALEFRRLLPLLAAERETLAVDLLGFGFTHRASGISFGTEAIKTHLYGFWQTVVREPVVLVGASMGGASAIDFTLTYPEAVSRLVLIDSAGLTNPPLSSRFMFSPLDKMATAFLRNPRVRQQISRAAYFDKSFASADAQLCAALHLEMPEWNRAIAAFTKSGGYGSFASQLVTLQQPTLILWGKNDKILGTKAAEIFKKTLPKAQLTWIDRCGHVPHLEKPQETARAILVGNCE